MIKLLKYNLNSDFESNKDSLNKLDNYVVLTADNQTIHLKPRNTFYVTTNNSGTTIYKRTDNSNGNELVTLENGENKLTDWNYGFYFLYENKQNQITSFDLSNFNTSKVDNMSGMFFDCRSLTSLDLSSFNTSNVSNMSSMFYDCTNLTSLDLSNFDTSNVTSMNRMFNQCSGLTSLNVSNFDTSNVTDMGWMFYECNKLTYIKCKQSFKDWCITNQDEIDLPIAMRNGGGGTWEIIDMQGS